MRYEVIILPKAEEHLLRLARSEPKAFEKANRFIKELAEHPKTGTGHPEPLKVSLRTAGAAKSRRNTVWSTASSTPRSMWRFSQPTDIMTTNNL